MTILNQDWKFLSLKFDKALEEVLMHQYFAAQYIAIVGRHLIPQREDDSNTSMHFDVGRQQLMGEKLKGEKRMVLHLQDLTIRYTEKNTDAFHGLSMDGLTREKAYQGIKQMLDDHGVHTGPLTNELHYDLPEHPLLKGSLFNAGESHHISENISYRHNAEVALQNILVGFPEAEPVRIWPHHFDTGSLIPVSHDENGSYLA